MITFINGFEHYLFVVLMAETVTISKAEYKKLKRAEKVGQGLLRSIARGIEDIKAGRIKKFA